MTDAIEIRSLLCTSRAALAIENDGRKGRALTYRLRPYTGDVTERQFAIEREVYDAVRERWPDAVGTLNVAEDDHKLWVIVWGSRAAVHCDNPVALVGKDDADPIFDAALWRGEAL